MLPSNLQKFVHTTFEASITLAIKYMARGKVTVGIENDHLQEKTHGT